MAIFLNFNEPIKNEQMLSWLEKEIEECCELKVSEGILCRVDTIDTIGSKDRVNGLMACLSYDGRDMIDYIPDSERDIRQKEKLNDSILKLKRLVTRNFEHIGRNVKQKLNIDFTIGK